MSIPLNQSDNVLCVTKLLTTGDYGIVKYLMDSNNDQGIEEFSVQLDTGTLTIKDAKRLDFEKTRSYRFSVEARDNYRENMLSELIILDFKLHLLHAYLVNRWQQPGLSTHHYKVRLKREKQNRRNDLAKVVLYYVSIV